MPNKDDNNSFYKALKQVRNFWTLNPRTRIRPDELKDKKKRRQESKRMSRDDQG